MVVSEAEAELQREVEELKLRLHMAAEHYKEKYRECQRLRRQVAKLSATEPQGVSVPHPQRIRQQPLLNIQPKTAFLLCLHSLVLYRSPRKMSRLRQHKNR